MPQVLTEIRGTARENGVTNAFTQGIRCIVIRIARIEYRKRLCVK